ncbi:MAG: hypothetical protein JNM63_17345 [Spirochaetia bacterium]|nr:hypothetical protein [Spirochaetia bacterium]
MSPELTDFRDYLSLRLAEYEGVSELCPNSVAVYKKYIQWLDESATDADFDAKVKADGQMFSVGKAEELDKRASLLLLQKKFDHERGATAAELRLKAVETATDYVSLAKVINAQVKLGGELDALEHQSHNAVVTLFGCITAWFVACEKEKSQALQNVSLAWQQALALDDQLSWNKICTHPPYRRRLVLDEARLERYGKMLIQAGGR